jgi:hypothetical protein
MSGTKREQPGQRDRRAATWVSVSAFEATSGLKSSSFPSKHLLPGGKKSSQSMAAHLALRCNLKNTITLRQNNQLGPG